MGYFGDIPACETSALCVGGTETNQSNGAHPLTPTQQSAEGTLFPTAVRFLETMGWMGMFGTPNPQAP